MFNQNFNSGQRPQYPQYGNQYCQFIPTTNKKFVRSLEEALSLPADFNSQNAYFDAQEDIIYDVCTNGRGEKSWSIFKVTLLQDNNTQQTQANTQYEDRLKSIEEKLEGLINGKYNVKQADSTNE